jgi:hypothetical protein
MSTRRLVHYDNPEGVVTPLFFLDQLRQHIGDEQVELVYAGERRWWTGGVRPNTERQKKGEAILRHQHSLDRHLRNPRSLLLAQLAIQGFAVICTYHGADPMGTVVVDPDIPDNRYETTILADMHFRQAEWRRDGGQAHFDARRQFASGDHKADAAAARHKDYLDTDGRDQYRRLVRGRIVAGAGGITGGDRAVEAHLIAQAQDAGLIQSPRDFFAGLFANL